MLQDTSPESSQKPETNHASVQSKNGLKKIPPYWYNYTTRAKGRWFNREILELVSTEFRDRSVEYYRYALESGVTTVNGKTAKPGTIVRNGDLIENMVHRHEPPITDIPVQILLHDTEREILVINKPGSIPVHATGRFFKHSLVEIMKDEFGFKQVYTVNRLDRLTSGLMILALSSERARKLTEEFTAGTIRKEYIARVKGEFPMEPVSCDQPLLTVDRQMGLNIVHPDGKPAQTLFTRLHYDPGTHTSVLHCRPMTGRSHQLRVHLQYLGFPIANDPVYSEERIWGKKLGRGGIDIIPSDERTAPEPPPEHAASPAEGRHRSLEKRGPIWMTKAEAKALTDKQAADTDAAAATSGDNGPKLLPRETGHDIGMGSPVPLSGEAVQVITRLRNQKDEEEDWSRWRDVVFRAKAALHPGQKDRPAPDPNAPSVTESGDTTSETTKQMTTLSETEVQPHESELTQVSVEKPIPEDLQYCPECYLPLHPDPNPTKLYIFLHALRYTTSLGSFETEMPQWAAPSWRWDQD